jgi:hypothetical protein
MSKPKKGKAGYEVGYKKPPVATRFRKGISGNPRGRRKNVSNLTDTLRSILNEKINVRVDGRTERHSRFVLLVRSLVAHAIKGEPSATRQVFGLMEKFGLLKLEDIQHVVTVELVRTTVPPKDNAGLFGENKG